MIDLLGRDLDFDTFMPAVEKRPAPSKTEHLCNEYGSTLLNMIQLLFNNLELNA